MDRTAQVKRKTSETDIKLSLKLGSIEESKIDSSSGFFNHMLTAAGKHGRIFLDIVCKGDNEVDDHHSIEDIGICLGKAFRKALGDKAGINRFGFASIPMDDALCQVSVDLSGRAFYSYNGIELKGNIKEYCEELTPEFLFAFAINAKINLHVNLISGNNRHHIHEAIFKALGVALYKAYSFDNLLGKEILSTKGTI